jgi:hypothetical protein
VRSATRALKLRNVSVGIDALRTASHCRRRNSAALLARADAKYRTAVERKEREAPKPFAVKFEDRQSAI